MNYPEFFDAKLSTKLFGLEENLIFLSTLYKKKKLPKVLMLSGNKGSGKSTLINHLLFSIFDQDVYDIKKFCISNESNFYSQFKNDIFSNIIYIKGSDFNSVKIEDIRNLKTRIFQSTILDKDRFIVLDDIEIFNIQSLNALLKIIEEPSKNNFFFLINNKSRPLLDTIKSRALDIKIILKEKQRIEITNKLVNNFKIEEYLDIQNSQLSPGNFVKFNFICKEDGISTSEDFVSNLSILLNLYKKKKDILFINIAFFLADIYFKDLKINNIFKNDKIYDIKNFIFDNLNNFLLHNINQNALINVVNNKLNYE